MSNRPTPETDAARHDMSDYGPPVPCSWGDWVPADITARLERERDELKYRIKEFDQALRASAELLCFFFAQSGITKEDLKERLEAAK